MLKRYDITMNGDDMLTDEEPDGEWVRFADVSADLAELTRWRAMASSPEICGRELDTRRDAIGRLAQDFSNCADVGRRLEARNRQLGDTIGRGELRIQTLEAQVNRLVARIDGLKADDGEPATESCFIHGAFVPTQEGACPKCWRGEP